MCSGTWGDMRQMARTPPNRAIPLQTLELETDGGSRRPTQVPEGECYQEHPGKSQLPNSSMHQRTNTSCKKHIPQLSAPRSCLRRLLVSTEPLVPWLSPGVYQLLFPLISWSQNLPPNPASSVMSMRPHKVPDGTVDGFVPAYVCIFFTGN